jgi:hypothetical protein
MTRKDKVQVAETNLLSSMRERGDNDSYGVTYEELAENDNGYGIDVALEAMSNLVRRHVAFSAYDGKQTLFILEGEFYHRWLNNLVSVDVLTEALSFHASRDMQDLNDPTTWQATVEGTFLCPRCLTLHNFQEVFSAIPANFSASGIDTPCGLHVHVLMPWEDCTRKKVHQ